MPNQIVQQIVDNAMSDKPAEVIRGVNLALRELAASRLAEIRQEITNDLFNRDVTNAN